MKSQKRKIEKYFREVKSHSNLAFQISASRRLGGLFLILLLFSGCNELQKPKAEPFYAETVPPPVQEFRWSNGKMPKSFDPARAAASPETDFARALYEGLTDTDPKTLQAIPAIAEKWTPSADFKTWTFHLRNNAKWSNGEIVTAQDFVRSWKRLVAMGERVPQRGLLKNIVGMDTENALPVFANEELDLITREHESNFQNENKPAETDPKTSEARKETTKTQPVKPLNKNEKESLQKEVFGVEALNDFTLKVTLVQPDKDFSSLVAHPIFRPIYGDGKEFESDKLDENIVTNGAFRVSSVSNQDVVLTRAAHYWNASSVELERVRIVPSDNAETALAAYRAGEIDAVTNAEFKPLALKLLAPYDDFRDTTHSALVYYVFNQSKAPFSDARVRKALAMAIERERLTEDEMDGISKPALGFSPFSNEEKLTQDVSEAQKLLAEAGFAEGKDFPTIRLLIFRNDMQRRIARAVARMWKKNLNVETEVIVKEIADFEIALQNGDYDIARRGAVLPTTDETANMMVIFPPAPETQPEKEENKVAEEKAASENQILSEKTAESNLNLTEAENKSEEKKAEMTSAKPAEQPILTEKQALETVPAIPLYFPTSYSLIKPYVQGFETNALDAHSLKNVKINNNWQPSNRRFISNDQK